MTARGLLLTALFAFPLHSVADTLGLQLGVATWNHDPSGWVQYQGDNVDLDDNLHLGSKQEGFAWISLEHPLPFLPNIKLSATRLSSDGSGIVSSSFTFGGQTYSASAPVDSKLNLDQTDATLYYKVLDNAANLDLGLTVKHIDGKIQVRSNGQDNSTSFNGYLPLLYGRVAFDFPLTGLSAGAEGNFLSYSGNSVSDLMLTVAYETNFRLGVEGGYRRQQIKLDNVDSVSADIKFQGPYLGLFFHF